MLKSEMHKLYRKLAILAVLIGSIGFLLSSGSTTTRVGACGDDYCISQFNSCRELYCNGQDCQPCVNQFVGCKDVCPQPEGTPQV